MIRTSPTRELTRFLMKNEITNLNIMGYIENHPDAEIHIDRENEIHGVLVRDGYFNYLYTDWFGVSKRP